MSEAKFTKGPYFVRKGSVNGMFTVHLGDSGFNRYGDYMQVALCESDSNAESVAYLFATAPEMYEEIELEVINLDRLLKTLDRHSDDYLFYSTEIERKSHLLAKARGEK